MALAPNGKRIQELRYERGLTQMALAENADVDQGHISRIESGDRGATPTVLKRLADALGVTVADITTDAEAVA